MTLRDDPGPNRSELRSEDTPGEEALARRIGEWYIDAPPPAERASHVRAIVAALADHERRGHPAPIGPPVPPLRSRPRLLLGALAGCAAAVALVFTAARRDADVRPVPSSPLAGIAIDPTAVRTRDVGFELRLADERVRRVTIAGDFNGWDAAALPMRRENGRGVWRVSVALPPGRHAYSFVVDGQRWVIDPLAPRTDEGALGPTNVVTVAGES